MGVKSGTGYLVYLSCPSPFAQRESSTCDRSESKLRSSKRREEGGVVAEVLIVYVVDFED